VYLDINLTILNDSVTFTRRSVASSYIARQMLNYISVKSAEKRE